VNKALDFVGDLDIETDYWIAGIPCALNEIYFSSYLPYGWGSFRRLDILRDLLLFLQNRDIFNTRDQAVIMETF
jgi:hypothetical protein